MKPVVAGLLFLALAMEVAREICFKLAANKSEQSARSGSYLLRLFGAPLVWLGFACWGTELVSWIMVLAHVPLSIAFPLMSLCYCGMIIASKYILKEDVDRKKWIGIGLITMGVALIGTQGVG
jgi:undecaprenyl phosphate-alpha-L-ara4N flippase subunit ArnE